MAIWQKISLVLLLLAAALGAIVTTIQANAMVQKFKQLQHQVAEKNLSRIQDAIVTEIQALGNQAKDWGSWDDTYRFVDDGNDQFSKVNLTGNLYETVNIDLLAILDKNGEPVYSTFRDAAGKEQLLPDDFNPKVLAIGTKRRPGPSRASAATFSGVQFIHGTPAIIFGRPILDSSEERPTRGTIVMARLLTPERLNTIAKRNRASFTLFPNATGASTNLSTEVLETLFHKGSFIEEPQESVPVDAYRYLTDAAGNPGVIVRASTVPEVLRGGISTVKQMIFNVINVLVVACMLSMLLVHLMVSAPLAVLAGKLKAIGEDHHEVVGGRLTARNDEIGTLARSFDDTLCRLAQTRTRLMSASREAGMAEVARGILHNAGNALNSVTVSVKQIETLSKRSRVAGLAKCVEMLRQNEHRLGEFLTTDPKGTQVLGYLEGLANALKEENRELQSEAQALATSTNHIVNLMQNQESIAQKSDQVVSFPLNGIVHEAVGIVQTSFRSHRVDLKLALEGDPVVSGDPSKLTQILVNLLTNAKEAIKATERGQGSVVVTSVLHGSGACEVRVKDDGPGIPADLLSKIFNSGFSTKDRGSGIGLHYCANAAAEMGWQIRAESEGLGKGSTFCLTAGAASQGREAA
ncbi:MAG: Adaptive-response sensory-kinase SasA [Fimbriimonadaceae bacterium]|nr:Adaptive-response sensory-kinase SasA [Fimbriimonadaceae bacterium]